MGQLLRLRKETRYALTLDRWFMLEAERRGRIEDLWEDYRFLVGKLGFGRLKLTLPDGTSHVWQAADFARQAGEHRQAAHEISDGTVIELTVSETAMPEILFTLLGDLASESWYKAGLHCRHRIKPALTATGTFASKTPPPIDALPIESLPNSP